MNITPTKEQAAILNIDYHNINGIKKEIVIEALAGTGKTTTLFEIAKRNLDLKFLYVCFNKSIQEEALKKIKKFKLKNITPKTIHGLSYQNIIKDNEILSIKMLNYINNKKLSNHIKNIEEFLKKINSNNIDNFLTGYIDLTNSKDKLLAEVNNFNNINKKTGILNQIFFTLFEFVKLNDKDINFNSYNKLKFKSNKEYIYNKVIILSNLVFNGCTNSTIFENPDEQIDSNLFLGHDFYKKMASNTDYSDSYDVLMVDECQDINETTLNFINEQKNMNIVYVGDSNQSIYAFTGASWKHLDEIKRKENTENYVLTTSFRHEKEILNKANLILKDIFSVINVLSKNPLIVDDNKNSLKILKDDFKAKLDGSMCYISRGVVNTILFSYSRFNSYKEAERKNKIICNQLTSTVLDENHRKELEKRFKETQFIMKKNTILLSGKMKSYQFLFDNIRDNYNIYNENINKFDSKLEKLSSENRLDNDELNSMLIVKKRPEIGKNIDSFILYLTKNKSSNSKIKYHCSTAHKVKGMEYDKVIIANDFYNIKKLYEIGNQIEKYYNPTIYQNLESNFDLKKEKNSFTYDTIMENNKMMKKLSSLIYSNNASNELKLYYVALTRSKQDAIFMEQTEADFSDKGHLNNAIISLKEYVEKNYIQYNIKSNNNNKEKTLQF